LSLQGALPTSLCCCFLSVGYFLKRSPFQNGSIILGNTFDNAIEACCSLPAEQRTIHLQLRKQYRSLFYRLENPYSDTSRGIRIGEHHGYGLKNINRIVQENHGDFYTKKKDGVFTVQVRLNCEN
jgi:two-component system sensor histidine kinase AgrC